MWCSSPGCFGLLGIKSLVSLGVGGRNMSGYNGLNKPVVACGGFTVTLGART